MTSQLDVRLTETYLTQLRRISDNGVRALIAIWDSLDSVQPADVQRFARLAVPVLDAVGNATAATSAGYFRQLIGREAVVAVTDLVLQQDLRHPFIGVWRDLKRGVPYEVAQRTGRDRAGTLATERVELAQNETARRLEQNGLEVGWRRVPQGATCSWCIRVASQRYRTADSAAFGHGHGGVNYCDCKKVPIHGSKDPGRVINEDLRRQWNRANKAEKPPAYFDVDDGELTAAPRP